MTGIAEFEVHVNKQSMAGASGPRQDALRAAWAYAFQYASGGEGHVTLFEIIRDGRRKRRKKVLEIFEPPAYDPIGPWVSKANLWAKL